MRGVRVRAVAFAVGLLAAAALPSVASAQFATLSAPPGPLTVFIGPRGDCQVQYGASTTFEMYSPSSRPANCGTYLAVDNVLFKSSGGGPTGTDFTTVSQSAVQGAGTEADPVRVQTVMDAGTSGLRITQTDSYVGGQESYRTDVQVQNVGAADKTFIVYRAADCYLQGSDSGYGFVDAAVGAAGCSTNPNNSPPARIEQWYPLSPGSSYYEAGFSEVWAQITNRLAFPNTCRCNERIDQGAGLSWTATLPAGGTQTFSHYTTFSPQGIAGPPRPPAPPPPPPPPPPPAPPPRPLVPRLVPADVFRFPAVGKRGCVSKRNFVIRIVRKPNIRYVAAQVKVNGRPTRVFIKRERYLTIRGKVLLQRRVAARVDLRGFPAGRFRATIQVIVAGSFQRVTGTRRYRTCARKGAASRPRV